METDVFLIGESSFIEGNVSIDLGSSRKVGELGFADIAYIGSDDGETTQVLGSLAVQGTGGLTELRIETGGGEIAIEGGLEFDSGSGADKFTVNIGDGPGDYLSLGDISVDTGGGNDQLQWAAARSDQLQAGPTTIATGGGRDTIELTNVSLINSLNIDTGSGNDLVVFDDTSTRQLTIQMGNGRDSLSLTSTFFGGDSFIDGESGFDTILNEDIAYFVPGPTVEIVGFEMPTN